MSEGFKPQIPPWDQWEDSSTNVPEESLLNGQPLERASDTQKHRKPSQDKRFMARKEKQDAFLSLSPSEALEHMEKTGAANELKKQKAQSEKWWRYEGSCWEQWKGQWYRKQWEVKERWLGPY